MSSTSSTIARSRTRLRAFSHSYAAAVGAHKLSMLQDLERGRSMEIEPMVGAVQELGRLTAVATPAIDIVLALIRQRASSRGTVG